MKNAEKFSQIANEVVKQMPVVYNEPEISFNEKINEGSIAKYESILNKVEKLAKLGFGSVNIILDQTTDLFYICETKERFYSLSEIVIFLKNDGFRLYLIDDYYDAIEYNLVWNENLKESPEKIEMNI